jgi:cytochrome c553
MAKWAHALAFAASALVPLARPALAQAAPVDAAPLVVAGRELALHGASGVPACFTCHGTQGLGDGGHFPRIAGQPAQFVVDRVHAFQARAREKVPAPGTMTAVSTHLDEQQIEAAAAFLSQLDAGRPEGGTP